VKPPDPGLCGTCRHSRVVETRRGSTFRLCERSATDARFPRYPNLPVLACVGYEARRPRPNQVGTWRVANSGWGGRIGRGPAIRSSFGTAAGFQTAAEPVQGLRSSAAR